MAFVHKKKLTVGMKEEVSDWGKEKARSEGKSFSVYLEELVKREMEKEEGGQK